MWSISAVAKLVGHSEGTGWAFVPKRRVVPETEHWSANHAQLEHHGIESCGEKVVKMQPSG